LPSSEVQQNIWLSGIFSLKFITLIILLIVSPLINFLTILASCNITVSS